MKDIFSLMFSSRRLLLLSVFGAAVLSSLIFLLFFASLGPKEHALPGTDYLSAYRPIVQRILEEKSIPLRDHLGRINSPGYPLFLVVPFLIASTVGIDEVLIIIIANTILSAFGSVFLFLIAEHLFHRTIALLAAGMWMTYPLHLWFIKNPHTEIPFIFFLYGALVLYLRGVRQENSPLLFTSAILLGFASLIRPIALFLPIVLAPMLFFLLKECSRKEKVIASFAFLLGYVLVLLPWEGYIFLRTGQILPLASGSGEVIFQGLIFALRSDVVREIPVPQDVKALMEDIKTQNFTDGEDVIRFSFQELRSRPIPFFKLVGLKVLRSWYATSLGWYEGLIAFIQLIYLIPACAGVAYWMRKYKEKTPYLILFLGIILYFWSMTFVALSIGRYMIPVMGFVMIFGALFLQSTLFSSAFLRRIFPQKL